MSPSKNTTTDVNILDCTGRYEPVGRHRDFRLEYKYGFDP